MQRFAWIAILLVFSVAAFGCTDCGKEKPAPAGRAGFATGLPSMDDLVKLYLETVEKKDPQALKQLLLTEEDFASIHKGNSSKYWQAYFMVTKRAFMDKNKSYLGKKLTLDNFQIGRQIADKDGVKVYRGTTITFHTPDNQSHTAEINFVVESGGTFKIFGLRYLSEELQRRGVLKDMGIFDGEAKFKGVDKQKDVNIKIKKKGKKAPAPAAPTE